MTRGERVVALLVEAGVLYTLSTVSTYLDTSSWANSSNNLNSSYSSLSLFGFDFPSAPWVTFMFLSTHNSR